MSSHSDASKNVSLGFGATFQDKWLFGQWEPGYIQQNNPSIEYLELYALIAAILTWGEERALVNARIIIFCDNTAVVEMVNSLTVKCRNCMYLL